MRTPANIAGHPIHPMLVTIPIGLWVFSLVCDLIGLRSGNPQIWYTVAFYAMVGGIIGALLAAVAGLVDLLSLKDAAIKKTALTHMVINLAIVVLFAINAWTRYNSAVSHNVSLLLSVIAIAALLVSGWLGGKMVYLFGVAVDTEQAMKMSTSAGWAGYAERPSGTTTTGMGGMRGSRAMANDSAAPSRSEIEREREERAMAGARERDASRDSNKNR